MDKKIVFGFTGVLLSAILLFTVASSIMNNNSLPSSTVSDGIQYHSNVCTYVTRADGTVEPNGCSHNTLYNNGKEMIEGYLGAGQSGAILNISLCNATGTPGCATPVAAMTEAFNNFTNCGLNAQNGVYGSLGTGNWSVAKTFTATCDNVLTNSTRLMNSTGSPFAGNTFTLVTLQTNDQLTINWTIWVS